MERGKSKELGDPNIIGARVTQLKQQEAAGENRVRIADQVAHCEDNVRFIYSRNV